MTHTDKLTPAASAVVVYWLPGVRRGRIGQDGTSARVGERGIPMAWRQSYTGVREALVRLFPRRDVSEQVVDEMGMRQERVNFSDRAESNWHEIISEADRSSLLPDLIRAARSRYPDDPQLRTAAEAYLAEIGPAGRRPAGLAPTDLAVIAAMPEGLNAFLGVAAAVAAWEEFSLDGFIHRRGEMPVDGGRLRVVAGSLWKYGADPTSAEVARLRSIRPRVLAMVGICAAGRGMTT